MSGSEATIDQDRGKPKRILFVDDEENIIKALRRLFADENLELLTATSGEEGLRLIEGCDNLALIVSDQRMPGMSGVEFLERARALAPDALRIVLTGYADITAAMGAINRGGAYRYLTKPWSDDELVRDIREAVAMFDLRRENKRLNELVKKQNRTLEEWNVRLKSRVLEQTREIIARNRTLDELNIRLRNNFRNTINAFANLLELRDKSSGNHAGFVTELSVRLAADLGLPAEEIETVRTAGLLHDIGKIGIGEELLKKNLSEMSGAELEEYQSHSVRGQAAIDAVADLRPAGLLIRHHHEWYNGRGWPDRLRDEQIPLGARIIGLADYVDRLMAQKPQREMITRILQKIELQAGPDGRFDANLLPYLKDRITEVYGTSPASPEKTEIPVGPHNLAPGMVLARNVVSGTGLLLLNQGSELNADNIKALQRYFLLDPPSDVIFVWQ